MGRAHRSVAGWFDMPNRKGDRSLQQQLIGLEPLLQKVKGKTVLDVGCAEGLISLHLAARGARKVHGVEIVRAHVDVAKALTDPEINATFEHADANDYEPTDRYDVTLMLAVLQKLRDPSLVAARMADYTKELCVVRLPPAAAPCVIDKRSGRVPHDIEAAMDRRGFVLNNVTRGSYDEWCGWFTRMDVL